MWDADAAQPQHTSTYRVRALNPRGGGAVDVDADAESQGDRDRVRGALCAQWMLAAAMRGARPAVCYCLRIHISYAYALICRLKTKNKNIKRTLLNWWWGRTHSLTVPFLCQPAGAQACTHVNTMCRSHIHTYKPASSASAGKATSRSTDERKAGPNTPDQEICTRRNRDRTDSGYALPTPTTQRTKSMARPSFGSNVALQTPRRPLGRCGKLVR